MKMCVWIPPSEGNTGQLKTQVVCICVCECVCLHVSTQTNEWCLYTATERQLTEELIKGPQGNKLQQLVGSKPPSAAGDPAQGPIFTVIDTHKLTMNIFHFIHWMQVLQYSYLMTQPFALLPFSLASQDLVVLILMPQDQNKTNS